MADRLQEMSIVMGEHWTERMKQFLADKPANAAGGVVMLGDSLTEHFPLSSFFPDHAIINRGIAGDTIPGVAARLDLSVRNLRPSRVLLMIGINDLLQPGADVTNIAQAYDQLLFGLSSGDPCWKVYLQSNLPACGEFSHLNGGIVKLNMHVSRIAENHNMLVIDTWAALTDRSGELRADWTWDGVHLTPEGYARWAEEIAPIIKQTP